jgi:hypothetical protein
MGESADIRLLHGVFRLTVVAQDGAGDPVEPAIVFLHDDAESRAISCERALDQLTIAG